jgi:hypothetical protein
VGHELELRLVLRLEDAATIADGTFLVPRAAARLSPWTPHSSPMTPTPMSMRPSFPVSKPVAVPPAAEPVAV